MKKIFPFFVALLGLCLHGLNAQTVPQGINYQTIVRNSSNNGPLADTPVTLIFTITDNGAIVYAEKQIGTTNAFGLVNLVIGQGDVQQGTFPAINWGSGPKLLSISLETSPNNFDPLGSVQLVSVPYALYAAESAKASVAANLADLGAQNGQVLQWDGNAWVPISLPTDGDTDSTNELQTWGNLPGIPAGFVDGFDDVNDADADPMNELQNWNSLPGIPPGFVDGFDNVDDADADPTNEIQTLMLDGNVLSILPGGSSIPLPTGTTYVEGNGIDISPTNQISAVDISATNEIQTLSISNNQLMLTNGGGTVTLPAEVDGLVTNEGSLSVQQNGSNTAKISSNTLNSSDIRLKSDGGLTLEVNPVNNTITLTNTGDTSTLDDLTDSSPAGGDVTGLFSNLQIVANAVGTPELADKAVTYAKLDNLNADNGEVLKYNGTAWVPAVESNNNYTEGAGIDITGNAPNFIITNSGDTDATNDLTISSTAAGDVSGPFSNLQIVANAVGATELADQAVTFAKLDRTGASDGKIIKYNGTAWALANDNIGGSDWNDCGPNKIFNNNTGTVGIGGVCPSGNYQMEVKTIPQTLTSAKGVLIDVNSTVNNVSGLTVNVENGSTSNDGVILLSRANNRANGMKIAAQSDGGDATGLRIFAGESDINNIVEDDNTVGQNYGVYIRLKDHQVSNNNSSPPDIGLYVKDENPAANWAIYADGDIATPNDIYADDVVIEDRLYLRNPNGTTWRFEVGDDIGVLGLYLGSAQVGTYAASGEYTWSDERWKEKVEPLQPMLPKLVLLKPSAYNYTLDPEKKQTFGFLAREVQGIFPELSLAVEDDEGNERLMLNYAGFSVVAIKAIQEQQQIIETQQTKIETQEARLSALEKEMAEIKAMIKTNMTANTGEK